MELLIILVVITIFSIIQSIIGIGLLLFGTPTFLLLGYSFIEALNILLPPSIAISFLQIINFKSNLNSKIYRYKKNFFFVCLPSLFLGLFIMSYNYDFINFNYFISFLLLAVVLLRLTNISNILFDSKNDKHSKLFFFATGLVHGLTNLGGSFLSLYASANFPKNKEETRYIIAFSYLVMGAIQFIYIQIFHQFAINQFFYIYIILSALIFKIFGNAIFASINNYSYQKLITIVILLYSLILIIK